MTSENNASGDFAGDIRQQYRMFYEIYVLLQEGDNRLLRDLGLTISQYGALVNLNAGDGQRLTTLSDRLLLARSTITRIIDQLENDGLVARVADPDDRRAQRVILTPSGVARQAQAQRIHHESLERRLNVLSGEERRQLDQLLKKIRMGLEWGLQTAAPDS